jgi:hypothetical protein
MKYYHTLGIRLRCLAVMPALLFLFLLFPKGELLASWTNPATIPPSGNSSAPLNTSGASQNKLGSLTVSGDFFSVASGNILIAENDKGIYWFTAADTTQPHVTFKTEALENVLYISSGDTDINHTEIQGKVKITNAGGLNPGELTISNLSKCSSLKTNVDGKVECEMSGNLWTSNGTDIYPNDTSWNIGVGTTTPSTKLAVGATVVGYASMLTLDELSDNGSNSMGIDWRFGGASGYPVGSSGRIEVVRDGVTTSYDMLFHTMLKGVLTERMRILADGNVAIPYLADCNGSSSVVADASGNLYCGANPGSLWKAGVTPDTITPVAVATDKVAIGLNSIADSTQLSVKNNSANSAAYIEQVNAAGYAGYFSGKTVVMGGNVGIGKTAPEGLLQITGNVSGGMVNSLVLDNEGSADNSGTAIYMGHQKNGLGLYGARILQRGNPNSSLYSDLLFQTHGSITGNTDASWITAMMIQKQSNNIGIGTITPNANLSVSMAGANGYSANHTITANNISAASYNAISGYKGNNGTSIAGSGVYGELVAGSNCTGTCAGVYGSAGGNSGTGEWAGYFDGDVSINGIRAGRGPGNVSTNTTFGYQALNSNPNTAGSNTAVGYQALYANVDLGIENTAYGSNALFNNSSGYANVAVGTRALNTNTTGYNNTAIGYKADMKNNNLNNATALGAGANATLSNMVRIGNASVTLIQGQVAWSVGSDARLKENIKDTTLGLGFINSLRPVQYNMKNGNGKTDFGFVAQDLEKILSPNDYNLVSINNDSDQTRYLRYNDLIAPMVKAIQEQNQIIEELRARITTLEKQPH